MYFIETMNEASEPTEFGKRLRAARTKAGMTIGQLARAVDVSDGAIRQMESGQTKSASLKVGLRIARVLNMTPEMLAGEVEAGTKQPVPSRDRLEVSEDWIVDLQSQIDDRHHRTMAALTETNQAVALSLENLQLQIDELQLQSQANQSVALSLEKIQLQIEDLQAAGRAKKRRFA